MKNLLIAFLLLALSITCNISCKKDNISVSKTCKEVRCIHNTHWALDAQTTQHIVMKFVININNMKKWINENKMLIAALWLFLFGITLLFWTYIGYHLTLAILIVLTTFSIIMANITNDK